MIIFNKKYAAYHFIIMLVVTFFIGFSLLPAVVEKKTNFNAKCTDAGGESVYIRNIQRCLKPDPFIDIK